MHIALTPDQLSLQDELRDYFAALMTPEVQDGLASGDGEYGDDAVYKRLIRQIGRGRLARHRLAEGVRRPGPLDDRSADLHRRGQRSPASRSRS